MPRRADAVVSRQRILAAAAPWPAIAARRWPRSRPRPASDARRSIAISRRAKRCPPRSPRRPTTSATPRPAHEPSRRLAPLPYQAPGRLGRAQPLALEVTHVLDEVPPHLIADQLVAEARRAAGVAVALYIVDIDGSQLIRLAGSEDFPETLDAPPALGPEIVPEGLPSFYEALKRRLPRCVAVPLWLRGRVIGLLLCVGAPVVALEDIAKQGAAALELANDYTDVIEAARRRKPTTAAAEVQYHLLPPRVARDHGRAARRRAAARLRGRRRLVRLRREPRRRVAGDRRRRRQRTRPRPGLSASALGALRAARRSGQDLVQAADDHGRGHPRAATTRDFFVTAVLARWHAPTATLAWLNCGHPPAYVADLEGGFAELEGPVHPALGAGDGPPTFETSVVTLESTDRLVLVTDGITERTLKRGGRFGIDGVRRAVRAADAPTAAATAMAIHRAVTELRCRTARGRRHARRPRGRLSLAALRRRRCAALQS